MSDQNKEIVKRYFAEIWSSGHYDVADELVEAGHQVSTGTPMAPDFIKHVASLFRTAFPDIKYDLAVLVAEGDIVVAHWKAKGTHKGMFRGVEPTGKEITYQGFDVYRVVNGKLVERWGLNDDLGLLQQLGAASFPPITG